MARQCQRFLDKQLALVKPRLVITLGEHAYDALRVDDLPYREALCRLVDTRDYVFFGRGDSHYRLLIWPHPSGLNRWLNRAENRRRLELTFDMVRPFLVEP
jgi:uracil-DNA glycosylase